MSLLVFLPGMVAAFGVWLVIAAFRPQHLRLDDALAALDGAGPGAEPSGPAPRGEKLGQWWLARRPAALPTGLHRALELKGRSPARHYTLKVLGALIGFLAPVLAGLLGALVGVHVVLPLLLSLVGLIAGFVLPDVTLRAQGTELSADATESLLTFFDLVTLERLANQSATQSLHAAASLSDNVIFAQLRAALERARLEQRMPYQEIRALGRRLDLPALVDLADVMRLDETGAALSSTLRARVTELRDAHLTDTKVAATRVSERMTLFMVIPSVIFGLLFLAPPLLKLISG